MENRTDATSESKIELHFDLGSFEGFNFREQAPIERNLTAEEVVNWDHDIEHQICFPFVGSGKDMAEVQQVKTTFLREVTVMYRGARKATTKITEAKDAVDFIQKILPDNSREHFVVLYLDAAHKVITYSLATGIANSCLVHPREVFQCAVLTGAIAVLVGHNHPSGNCTPSNEDMKITRQIKNAGEILGIRLLDHVILGEESFHSFSQAGML